MEGGVSESRLRVNAVAIGEMRAAVLGIVRDMVETRRAAGSLGSLMAVTNLLSNLGERDEARRLHTEVIEGYTAQLGVQHTRTLDAKMNLANLLSNLGERDEARRLYTEVIEGYTVQLGAQHAYTLIAKLGLRDIAAKCSLTVADDEQLC
jgi:hypothetical protein